jgi:hypothetical protein
VLCALATRYGKQKVAAKWWFRQNYVPVKTSLRDILGSVFTAHLRITLRCQWALIPGHSVHSWELVIFVSSCRVDERWSIPDTCNSTAPRLVLGPMPPSSEWKTTASFHQHIRIYALLRLIMHGALLIKHNMLYKHRFNYILTCQIDGQTTFWMISGFHGGWDSYCGIFGSHTIQSGRWVKFLERILYPHVIWHIPN